MDYSSLPNDPDHPVGSSPWQSSPQPTSRPSFTASEAGSMPSSPLAGESSDQDIRVRRNPEENAQPVRSNALENSQSNGNLESPPLVQQPPQSQSQQQPRQSQSQQQRGAPNRYHGGANRNVQKQNLPQYKLQAKVTSLERTGRKDPVLRFDVHVSLSQLSKAKVATDVSRRRTFQNSGLLNFEMSAEHTRNLPNSLII